MTVQAAMGLLEILALALLPVLLVPVLSRLVGESYPLSQSRHLCALWFGIGSVVFAAAYLSSALFANEYSALAVSLVALYIYPLAVRLPSLRQYPLHIHYLMNGTGTILLLVVMVALGFILSATIITQKKDFS
jgi:hypothetical protein